MMWKLSTIGGAAAVSFRHSNSMHSLVSGWSCSDDLHCLQHEHCEGYDAKKEGVCRPKPCDDDKHCDSNSLVCIKPCDMPGDTTGCDSSANGHCTKKCGYATDKCKKSEECGTGDHCDEQEGYCHLNCEVDFKCLTADSLSVCVSEAKIAAHQKAYDAKVAADNAADAKVVADKVKAAVDNNAGLAAENAADAKVAAENAAGAKVAADKAMVAVAADKVAADDAKDAADDAAGNAADAKDDAGKAKVAADKVAASIVI